MNFRFGCNKIFIWNLREFFVVYYLFSFREYFGFWRKRRRGCSYRCFFYYKNKKLKSFFFSLLCETQKNCITFLRRYLLLQKIISPLGYLQFALCGRPYIFSVVALQREREIETVYGRLAHDRLHSCRTAPSVYPTSPLGDR